MGKKEQAPALAIFVQGSLWVWSANLVCGAPADYLESTAFGAMISVPHWTFFVVERIKESFCSGRQLHHSPLLQSAVYTQVLLLSE